jgi:[ribosomal protein S5]-alanine N-acetyltransferase
MQPIKTKRLILRNWKQKDEKDLIESLDNLNVTKWMLIFPHPFTKKDATKLLKKYEVSYQKKNKENYSFAISLKESGKVIGGINLSKINPLQKKGMTSYWINEDYWQKGYGSEAMKAILDFGLKKLKLRRIDAGVYPGNRGSSKLLKKFGFKKEGRHRKCWFCVADKKIKDSISYGLLKEEYRKCNL